jgi:hypothetical protein
MKHLRLALAVLSIALRRRPAARPKPTPPPRGRGPVKLDPKSPEGRAVARWQYIVDGKPEKAYDYLSPGPVGQAQADLGQGGLRAPRCAGPRSNS